jgi:hypothetical protein
MTESRCFTHKSESKTLSVSEAAPFPAQIQFALRVFMSRQSGTLRESICSNVQLSVSPSDLNSLFPIDLPTR